MNRDEQYIRVLPHERQLAHQKLEFYAFFHFSMNTFTDREWGDGAESPYLFYPTAMDASQWVQAVRAAGMKGAILTCKHHDGFCLWPSKYTRHSIASSLYQNGVGDIVKEVSLACQKYGLKFGIYLSPWDRNSKLYGLGREYDDYYIKQLEELLTGYGEIFSVWLDGACGEGENGKKQEYDWDRYFACIRRLQPKACISVCGSDVRWCGNEAGDTRKSEWSVVPQKLVDMERIQKASQQNEDSSFRHLRLSSSDQDLGSRMVLEKEEKYVWYPAEVNTSIRPGWFYHQEEDAKVLSLRELIQIYYRTVGGNSTFLLNIPPKPDGLLAAKDVARLEELGEYLKDAFSNNYLNEALITADSCKVGCGIENVRDDEYQSWYEPEEGHQQAEINIELRETIPIRHIVLKENITRSQRVEQFEVYIGSDETQIKVYEGTVIGYKKIIPLKNVAGDKIRILILDSRVCPTLSFLGIY